MTSKELRQKYLDFFIKKGHKVIPSAPLVPENDPSVLFTTAGMHPLVPFLLGQPHPQGKRLVDVQKCLRTDDIDEVGDVCHHTFFEMLGNWSLGNYFKEEAIRWSFEFLTSPDYLNLPKEELGVSVFQGDQDAPFDQESFEIWKSLGIPEERIAKLPKKDNWWGPAGETGPCGPDTEMFIWIGEDNAPRAFDPKDKRWVEIWNDVFMEYNKTSEGKFELLSQKNVDTGMGLERALAVSNKSGDSYLNDDYLTDVFLPAIKLIEKLTNLKYGDKSDDEYLKAGQQCWVDIRKQFRIIADHLRASVFIIADGVEPSNKERGYILRRLIRRSAVKIKSLKIENVAKTAHEIVEVFIDLMSPVYPEIKTHKEKILETINLEINKFNQTLERGLKEFQKLSDINGKVAFDLFQTYGFPLELTEELAQEKGLQIDHEEFRQEFEKHKELSRTASAGMFKGGLADQSEITTKYHTATHLLNAALRQVLGTHVEQKGSNITAERLRFDFSQPERLTEEQLKEVENIVNQKIQEGLPVNSEVMDKDQALKSGALGFFGAKYGDKVTVYTIGNPSTSSGSPFSREICGGPHVNNTKELGKFTITKEESASSGVRRIYAKLD